MAASSASTHGGFEWPSSHSTTPLFLCVKSGYLAFSFSNLLSHHCEGSEKSSRHSFSTTILRPAAATTPRAFGGGGEKRTRTRPTRRHLPHFGQLSGRDGLLPVLSSTAASPANKPISPLPEPILLRHTEDTDLTTTRTRERVRV